MLVRGDSPWSGLSQWSPGQAEFYFADREQNGFNASIISLIGNPSNGGPYEDGRTYDGLAPFIGNDITKWNEDYWQRMTSYVDIACIHGNTLFLYPIDAWTYDDGAFASATVEQARQYGRMVAERFAAFPNIVWVTGGDYGPDMSAEAQGEESDHRLAAVIEGIREAGTPVSGHPFSIQFGFSSTSSPFWAKLVDWNFVYSYYPTYAAVLYAYRDQGGRGPMPSVLGEANYERENNTGGPPTTNETLRRQLLWSLTSGSAGYFYGSSDWQFHQGWETRLDTTTVTELDKLQDWFAGLSWWSLVPDDQDPLVIDGRGLPVGIDDRSDVLDNDYVSAARSPDGSLAVVYVPTSRTIRLDRSKIDADASALWVDPADPTRTSPAMIDDQGSTTSPGQNSEGDGDWLLMITG